jgi:hypothetical protein
MSGVQKKAFALCWDDAQTIEDSSFVSSSLRGLRRSLIVMQRLQQKCLFSQAILWMVGLGVGWGLFSLSSVMACPPASLGLCLGGNVVLGVSFLGGAWSVWRAFGREQASVSPVLRENLPKRELSRFCPLSCLQRDVYADLCKQGARVASRIHEVPREAWDRLIPLRKMPLRTAFLEALEQAPPDYLVGWRYVWWEEEGEVRAVASFQLLEIPVDAVASQIPAWLQSTLGGMIGMERRKGDDAPIVRLLLCGNALSSGDFGFHADASWRPERLLREIAQVQEAIGKDFARSGRPVVWSGIKDLPAAMHPQGQTLEEIGMIAGRAEPVMAFHFDPTWHSFADYQEAMASKYRQRLRAARKKGAALQRRALSLTELQERQAEIQGLFEQVLSRADFCMVRPHAAMLVRLKAALGEDLIVQLYEVEGRAVGFLAGYRCGEILEANWVGMDYAANAAHCLYQNLLYDFVEIAFAWGCRGVDMGRTATEIKSCVGAEPEEMAFYLRAKGPILQRVLRSALAALPAKTWEIRHPFRVEA